MFRGGILAVCAEISLTHKLEALFGFGSRQTGFHLAACQDLQRIRVQTVQEILISGVGSFIGKEIVI